MKRPIDAFKDKDLQEIYEKEDLLDENNLEKGDRLAMFLAAMKAFLPGLLILIGPLLLFAMLL